MRGMAFQDGHSVRHTLHQAQLSSLDEVAKKLTLLINLGENWVYALCVQLNVDAQHVPLL